MRPAILFAPAKLNLGLRVTGRYANGYHHLESLFVPVTLYDRLEIGAATGAGIRYRWHFARSIELRRSLALGTAQNPLLWKSMARLGAPALSRPGSPTEARQGSGRPAMEIHSRGYGNPQPERADTPDPVMDFHSPGYGNPAPPDITVYKRIPSPSGLGGASSDAAALIAHLADLTGPGQATPALMASAAALGADIPYFLQYGLWGEAAELSGVGAQLRAVALPRLAGIIAVPPFGFSTAAMFGYFRARDLPTVTEDNPPEALQSKSALRLNEIRYSDERFPGVRVAQNDFEQAAAAVFPKEAQLLSAAQAKVAQAVRQIFPGTWLAGLTGSGPALYAVTEGFVASADLKRLSAVLMHRLGALWQVYPIRSHRR